MTARDIVMAAAGVSTAPTIIGQAYGGGYYAGKISTTGNGVATHYLIVAPKASGQSIKKWRTYKGGPTAGTFSVIDGPANSTAMNNTNHPAAYFCKGLTIGGYNDWYMPSRNELEVCYTNLKPTTTSNFTADGGYNENAVPPRLSNYTSTSPLQTSVTIFKTGNAEAFVASQYFASTGFSGLSFVSVQSFSDGSQSPAADNVVWDLNVRAVRRVPINS